MSHSETVPMDMTTIPQLDFGLLLQLAQNNPDRYTDMRSSLVNSTICRLDAKNGELAELQRKIDRITAKGSLPDQVMLEIVRLLSERISALSALTAMLQRELLGTGKI